ncbi:hypothetical protein Lser_V15G00699 [Lactuca serriola]
MQKWSCLLNPDGIYSVEAVRLIADQNPAAEPNPVVVWCKEIPIKVLGFVWKAEKGRIPTPEALSVRGVPVDYIMCGLCREVENANHIMISCPFATKMRN